MRPRSGLVMAATGIALAGLCLSARPAAAQTEPDASAVAAKKVTIVLENADIRYALKMLFQNVGVNFALDPTVQGTVTVSLTDTPFRAALETILKNSGSAVPLTYRVENGVWMVSPKPEEQPEVTTGQEATTEEQTTPKTRPIKIQVNFADAYDISAALGGGYLQTRMGQMSYGGGGGGYGGGGFGNGGYGGGFGNNYGGGGFGGGGFGGGGFGGGGFGGGGFGGGGFGGGGFGGGGFGGGGFGGGGFGGGGFRAFGR